MSFKVATLVLLASVLRLVAQTTPAPLVNSFTNPTPYYNEAFGTAVAVLGNGLIAVSAPGDGEYPSESANGTVYLFTTGGTLVTAITNPAPLVPYSRTAPYFGRAIVSLGLDRLVITGRRNDLQSGGAVVWLFGTDGTLLATFNEPGVSNSVLFGWSVATLGTTSVAISTLDRVFIFNTNGAVLNTITNPGVAGFGCALSSLGPDRLVVRTYGSDGWPDTAAALLYGLDGTLLSTLTNAGVAMLPSPDFPDSLASVGVIDDKVLLGSPGNYQTLEGYNRVGSAFMCDTNGGRITEFVNPGPVRFPRFGRRVGAIGTNKVVVTALGGAFVFDLQGTLLAMVSIPVGDLGFSLAISADRQVLLGARMAYGNFYGQSGAAYLFGEGPDVPRLNSLQSYPGGPLTLWWAAPWTNFVLEYSDQVQTTNPWTRLPHNGNPSALSNWHNFFPPPPATQANFFRLRKSGGE